MKPVSYTHLDVYKRQDETLSKMGLDYLDVMIIHSPQPWVEVNRSEDRYVEGNRAAWRALELSLIHILWYFFPVPAQYHDRQLSYRDHDGQ